jgi:cytochrome P450
MLTREFNLKAPRTLLRFLQGMKRDAAQTLNQAFNDPNADYDGIVLKLGGNTAHIIRDPEMVGEGVRAVTVFQKSPEVRDLFSFFGQSGVFTSMHDEWSAQRTVLARALTHGNLPKYEDAITEEVDALIDKFAQQGSKDLYEDFKDFAITTFFKSVLGFDVTSQKEDVKKHIDNLNEYFPKRALSPISLLFNTSTPSRKYKEAVQFLDQLMTDIHAPHMAAYQEGETVSEILKSTGYYDAKNAQERQTARTKSFEQATQLFVAGYESTASSMTWLFYRLANNPEVQNAVCAELGEKGPVDAKNYKQKDYLQQTILETVRINPTLYLSVPRKATEDFTFRSGYTIAKGDYFMVPIFSVNTDERSHQNAYGFNPARENKTSAAKGRHKETNMSFYAGAHACTGKSLFMFEASLLTARALERLQLHPARMPAIESKTSMTPQSGFGMTFSPRATWPVLAHADNDTTTEKPAATAAKCPFHRMMNKI